MSSNYANPLPGVPHIESPFFPELFDASDADYAIARSLNERGYAVFDFPDPDFSARADRIIESLAPSFDLIDWRRGGDGGIRVQDAWTTNADVRSLAANPQIVALLTRLYGRTAFPFQTLNFPVGTQQHCHTDSVHFSSRPERFMCGVWAALEDIGPDQGPLIYYPGSHTWPIYTNEHIGQFIEDPGKSSQHPFEALWKRLIDVNGAKPERLSVRKGQALIWTANLLHGGDVHRDRTQTRWSQVTHYYFDDCTYYTPLASNEAFGQVLYRKPYNIVSGEIVENFHLQRQVPEDYLVAASFDKGRGPPPPSPWGPPEEDFDPELYLAIHHDVAADKWNAYEHFYRFGRAEGRRLR